MLTQMVLFTIFGLYAIASIGLFTYGINCYWLLYIFLRNHRQQVVHDRRRLRRFYANGGMDKLPVVTTQLPVFNEANVIERLLRTVVAMEYPAGKHEIQVLDDSTDGSESIAAVIVNELRAQGHDIKLIHRTHRKDYKAGALNEGMDAARGEFIAIFDADFVPPSDYLLRTVPFLCMNEQYGLVQARWGHLNSQESSLTLAQSIGIDGHFVIEQSARSWGSLFMNFNGTAGVWRKSAIVDAGGWEGDTLTEDMDLSYRAQLKGWKMKFAYDVVVPAELPADINAFKSQQFRWAKGSIQTAMKLLPQVLRSNVSWRVKLQAVLHTTHYSIHPLMLLTALLALPLLYWFPFKVSTLAFTGLCVLIVISSLAPSILYLVAQRMSRKNWKSRMLSLPTLMAVGVGVAFNNTRAVLSALSGNKGTFVRTPKAGDKGVKAASAKAYHKTKFPVASAVELALGAYCFIGFIHYTNAEKYLVGPFLGLYAVGFLVVGFMSLLHWVRTNSRRAAQEG
jgi:cellulose synthase/poly-beta-1,6-N-acetylglucosamine synthase-like glycosyltransferase